MLTVEGVHKSYGDVVALDGLSLTVDAGDVVALLGPNGAGKTTLISCIAGLRQVERGSITVDGIDASITRPGPRSASASPLRRPGSTRA